MTNLTLFPLRLTPRSFVGKVNSNHCQAFRAVRDFDLKFGFKSETTYNKKGDNAQFYNLQFIHFETFVFQLSQLCDISEIRESLKKSFSIKNPVSRQLQTFNRQYVPHLKQRTVLWHSYKFLIICRVCLYCYKLFVLFLRTFLF